MADGISIKLEGDRDLLAAFLALRTDMGPKYLMRAVRKAANMMKTIIAASAPVDTGNLRSHIKIRTRKTMETVRAGVIVRETKKNYRTKKSGNLRTTWGGYYWRFIEYGHRVRTESGWKTWERAGSASQYIEKVNRRSGRRGGGGYKGPTKDVPPQPFVEPSWRNWKDYGVRLMTESFEKSIDRAAAKQRRGVR